MINFSDNKKCNYEIEPDFDSWNEDRKINEEFYNELH